MYYRVRVAACEGDEDYKKRPGDPGKSAGAGQGSRGSRDSRGSPDSRGQPGGRGGGLGRKGAGAEAVPVQATGS